MSRASPCNPLIEDCSDAPVRPTPPLRLVERASTGLSRAELERASEELADADAARVVRWAVDTFGGGLVLSTSFGIQSAVMLHLATREAPYIPVIWVDTGYLPPETYRYAEELMDRLDLDVRVYQPRISAARMEALYGRLWESDHVEDIDRYDRLRKVEPLQRALRELGASAWLSGLRADQTEHRATLPRVGEQSGRAKILPLLRWTARDVHRYMKEHDLPRHPLFEHGYATVGDLHSSRPVTATDRHERETRFRGLKQECGLHLTEDQARSLESSRL